ncbi:MAG: lasso peptide biosynthesis B2 protein [Gemmatimonadota bacterium]
MRILRTIHRYRARSWSERGAFVMAAVSLLIIRTALFVLPFRRVVSLVERLAGRRQRFAPSRAAVEAAARASAETMIWAVDAAGRRLFPAKPCLPQALAVLYGLRRRRLPAELRIGVARDSESGLLAHAWVDSEGKTVIGDLPAAGTYTPLPPLGLDRP